MIYSPKKTKNIESTQYKGSKFIDTYSRFWSFKGHFLKICL